MAKHITQRLKKKICQFPGCGITFIGKGKAKYCEEHRKNKYRKDLYNQNDNDGSGIIRIEHSELYAKRIVRECELDGCSNKYEIVLLPRIYEYPRYCPEHMNIYKRKLFIEKQKDSKDE